MKLLYFTTLKESNSNNMSQWQIAHIVRELRIKGWEIELYYPENSTSIEEVNTKLLSHIKRSDNTLFLSVYNEKILFPETLKEIHNQGIITILICFDNLVIPFEHKNIAKYYDIVWLTSRETEYLFKQWGANTIFLPYAANPQIIKTNPTKQYKKKVCFVGTPYGARKVLLNKFVRNNLPIDIFGTIKEKNNIQLFELENKRQQLINLLSFPIGRKLLKGTIKYRFFEKDYNLQGKTITNMDAIPVMEVPELYESYSLSLASTSARNTEVLKNNIPIINLRSFEIPMSYGLQICRYNEELAGYFEEDKEIIFYHDEYELQEKVNFYIREENNEIVKKMKLAARKRAENEHTWTCRFNSLLTALNIY